MKIKVKGKYHAYPNKFVFIDDRGLSIDLFDTIARKFRIDLDMVIEVSQDGHEERDCAKD